MVDSASPSFSISSSSPAHSPESADKPTKHLLPLESKKRPTTPATSFTLFPNLAVELRLQIWRSYLLNPRLITISAHPSSLSSPLSTTASSTSPATQTFHILRDAPCPLLSVNSEARHEAIRFYSQLPDPEEVEKNRLPFHPQHKSSTRGFYRSPGSDVVYLQGCYYDSRWFRGFSVVGREVIARLSGLLAESDSSSFLPPDLSLASPLPSKPSNGQKVPLVGRIKTLALDQAFLADETLFGTSEMSPVMVYLMRDLKGLEELIIVRGEGEQEEEGEVQEVENRIEEARAKLVWQCNLWWYAREMEALKRWVCPRVRVVGQRKLEEWCGVWVGEEASESRE